MEIIEIFKSSVVVNTYVYCFSENLIEKKTAKMSDLFKREDVVRLLRGRTLVILGGSIMRGLYKDIIWLMNCDTLINRGVSCSCSCVLKNGN